MDPQSRPGEFSSSEGSCGATRRGPFAVNACRLLRSRLDDVCTFSGCSSATTGFHRRSEDPEAGGPPADSFPPVGSYSLRDAGRRETEDRPAALRSCPCVHVSTCGYCLSEASGR